MFFYCYFKTVNAYLKRISQQLEGILLRHTIHLWNNVSTKRKIIETLTL